ncbi:MAG: DNA primase [Kiritimatiellae bacterium]|nr:DNA primase [Kiritimatiellia bacterium]
MSGRITEQVIEEIRARIDIVDLIGARMTLKKAGSAFKGCCPFHHEKTPSFHVNQEKQFYHCFGCGESGDVFTFLMKQDGLSFTDAARLLAERVGVVIEEQHDEKTHVRQLLYAIHTELAAFYQRCLRQTKEAQAAREYLAKRKMSDSLIECFGIGYAPAKPKNSILQWASKHNFTPEQLVSAGVLCPPREQSAPDDFYDRFAGRLMFPICDRPGRVVAFSGRLLAERRNAAKYVNSPETEIFTKSRVLYALDKASSHIVKHPRREAIVCEGQIDVIRCHDSGFNTAVAAQGTAFTKEHVSLLKRYADSVVLVFDGDSAGRKAALRTGTLFLEEEIPVRVAVLPKGEDPDSLLRDQGPSVFREALETADSVTAFQIKTFHEDEAQPDSIDALNRITRDVFETLAGCDGAVLRTRLLQEAAELLHLPYSALEQDLEKYRDAARNRAAHAASFKTKDTTSAPNASAQPDHDLDTDEGRQDDSQLDVLSAKPILKPPSTYEQSLCELLVEHEHDLAVLGLVEEFLPEHMIEHPFAKLLVRTLAEQRRTGEDLLAKLHQTAAPCWLPLLEGLLTHKHKMLGAKEMTKEDAARDLITRIWIARIKQKRDSISPSSTAETDAQRLTLSTLMKKLEMLPWESACLMMRSELQTEGYIHDASGA